MDQFHPGQVRVGVIRMLGMEREVAGMVMMRMVRVMVRIVVVSMVRMGMVVIPNDYFLPALRRSR